MPCVVSSFRPVGAVCLRQDVADVGGNSIMAYEQLLSDSAVGGTGCKQAKHLEPAFPK